MGEQKRTALVTGASSGMGRETAVKLAERGFEVIAAARRLDRLNALADQFPEKASALRKQLDSWRKEVGAQLPRLNPEWNSTR